jgi:GNAT superfamily N-acetyltransferase
MLYKTVKSTITFLKMDTPSEEKLSERLGISLQKVSQPLAVDKYRALYASVGEKLNWLDRILMDDNILYHKINAPTTHIYSFNIHHTYAGYCEMVINDKFVELLYFGLIPDFVGKGYGHYLLRKTIERAWSFQPEWIQLNTCDLDHPNALKTYLKAGFKPYQTIVEEKKVRASD